MSHLNEEQRQAVEHGEGPLLIVAGAGTGKTRVIVEKVGHLLRSVQGIRPENILALTFTDKAAGEMQQRAAKLYGEPARGCLFSTFHSFCYRLLTQDFDGEARWKAIDKYDHWIFLRRNLESLDLDHYFRASEPGRFLHDLLEFCSRCQDNLVSPSDFLAYVERLAAKSLSAPSAPSTKPPSKAKAGAKSKATITEEEEIRRLQEVARVFARSEELQEQNGLLSFGAMISRAVAQLKSSPDLLQRLQRRYRYILVDEFQDTNWAQIELLRLLAGDHKNLTVVGDKKQAIYHFRGASRASFELFKKTFSQHARAVPLKENYRSTKSILAVANLAISHSSEYYEPDENLVTLNAAGQQVKVWEFAGEHEQAEFLAREMARQVKAGEAADYSDFAVLYRAHRHRNLLVRALRRHGVPFSIRKLAINNLPPVRDLVALLRSIGDPKDSVSLLRVMAGMAHAPWKIESGLLLELCRTAYGQRMALSEVIEPGTAPEASASPGAVSDAVRNIAPALGAPGLGKFIEFLRRYREIAKDQRLGGWLTELRMEANLFAGPEETPAWNAFLSFVLDWDKEKSATGLLGEFLEYFGYFEEAGGTMTLPDEEAATASQERDSAGMAAPSPSERALSASSARQAKLWEERPLGKVQLMTVHGAKGLEFEKVFLLQMVRGAFPTRRHSPLISFPVELLKGPPPEGDPHTEEERRLFYVALTRAKSSLTLCTVSNAKQHPSVFLEQLWNSNCPELEWKTIPPCGAPGERMEIPAFAAAAVSRAGDGLALSVSALETYLECPLKYFYGHLCRVPVVSSAALRFGSIMHDAIKQLIGTLAAPPQSIDAQSLESILRAHWSPAGFTDPVQERKYWEMGLEQLQGVSRAFSAKPFELLYQEKPFEFLCAGSKITGRIDQINRVSGKEVELIEYKTGRPRTLKDAQKSLQLTIYARACREVLGLDPVSLVLYNLATQEELRTQRGPEDFGELEETLSETSAGIAAGRFSPSRGFHCAYCDFRPICPAHEDQD
jgi:ATP-dependent DNA helicase UvrD/PcrA